jgi:uncharacterized protein
MASLGIGGFLVVLVLSLVFGVDLFSVLGVASPLGGGPSSPGFAPPARGADDQEKVAFVSAVLDDTQALWADLFRESGLPYEEAQLVLDDGNVRSACGTVPEAAGPFYCPLDGTIYLSFGFYDLLRDRYGASGDFAEAYVIAHEMGHHVQNLLGTAAEVREQQQAQPARANRLSVALELQADCYAGVWGGEQLRAVEAQAADNVESITLDDFRDAIAAAAAIGDDAIQRRTRGSVNPESFTHGTSEQRASWFTRGFESGDPNACDTFAAL